MELNVNIEKKLKISLELIDIITLKRYFPSIQKKVIARSGKLVVSNPEIPKESGIYFLFNNTDLIYIGKTLNLRHRIASHLYLEEERKEFNNCTFILEKEEMARILLEYLYCLIYKPKLNKIRAFRNSLIKKDNGDI